MASTVIRRCFKVVCLLGVKLTSNIQFAIKLCINSTWDHVLEITLTSNIQFAIKLSINSTWNHVLEITLTSNIQFVIKLFINSTRNHDIMTCENPESFVRGDPT